ncbi:type II toxin-antitoxin system RelE/ParE family toxin [Candidatus Electrothrix sp.]|uniref:type II toxin-antitoxin system RelE/ParE family toxin n=1 Tax=Candidatus Electrothrix sp. TaxID=2170559 RepID=UPI004055F7DC
MGKKAKLSNESLLEAIDNLEKGLSAADLGSNLYKVRVQRSGKGKSSGFRTIIVYRSNEKAIFLYGFGKNEKSNINKTELKYFKKLGNDLLALNTEQIADSLKKQILFDLEVSS